MTDTLNIDIIKFVATQVPSMKIIDKQIRDKIVIDWQYTLKSFLQCDKDYSTELKAVLDKDVYRVVSKSIANIVQTYITNGELTGLDNFKPMHVERQLIKNRVTAKVYQAYVDGEDITTDLYSKIQKYASPYCMLLNNKEERAICVTYRACQMCREDNGINQDKEDIFSIAYTFFCLRVRKAYSAYETALRSANCIEDGLLAAVAGFAMLLNEFDFSSPLDTGVGPGTLNICIFNEIDSVLQDAFVFSMSTATRKKVFAFDAEKHAHLSRQELMQLFHCTSSLVDVMLSYGPGVRDIDKTGIEYSPHENPMFNDNEFRKVEFDIFIKEVLNDDERKLLEYIIEDELKYKEVAEIMGTNERRIKYQFDLLKNKLRKAYAA